MSRMAKENSSGWLYLIPIYHLMTDAINHQGQDILTKYWWGTAGFDDAVQKMKKSSDEK